jgi:hypothetical protein
MYLVLQWIPVKKLNLGFLERGLYMKVLEWLWVELSWIHLTRGEAFVIFGLLGSIIVLESISWITKKESMFF